MTDKTHLQHGGKFSGAVDVAGEALGRAALPHQVVRHLAQLQYQPAPLQLHQCQALPQAREARAQLAASINNRLFTGQQHQLHTCESIYIGSTLMG